MPFHVPRNAIVAQCDVVWSLMRSFSSGQEPVVSLPPKLQRMLMLSLLSCEAGERQEQFTREVGWIFTEQLLRRSGWVWCWAEFVTASNDLDCSVHHNCHVGVKGGCI